MINEDYDKKIKKSIRRQLEFYFSEGNLPRDEFMKSCIKASMYNSVPIKELLKFNKLIELNASEELIILSLIKSKILELDDENQGVRRIVELNNLKPVDCRTIFVCGFLNEEHLNKSTEEISKELKKIFKIFGTILRIDLPKYPSSKSLRGFAFIEFLMKSSTKTALKEYKLMDRNLRKAASWNYFSYSNNQYSHALKQLELLGHPQKLFFEEMIGDQRKEKSHSKIIAIAKKEWLVFRSEFYAAQQEHLKQMKTLLNQYLTKGEPCSHKEHERKKAKQPTFEVQPTSNIQEISDQIISGSIVAFQCPENFTKKSIKSALSDSEMLNDVAYIDFRDFNLAGFLRFKSSSDAAKFASKQCCLVQLHVLTALEERDYLTKIFQDKEMKKESQKRKNNRKRKLKEKSEMTEN